MSTIHVRVRPETKARLKTLLLELEGPGRLSESELIERALDAYEDLRFWEKANRDYAALNADADARARYDAELAAWDVTLADGAEPPHEP